MVSSLSLSSSSSSPPVNNDTTDDNDSLFAPLSVGQTIRRSWSILVEDVSLFFTLGAVVVIPIVLIIAVSLCTISWELKAYYNGDWFAFAFTHGRPLLLVLLLLITVYIILGSAVQATVIRIVAELYAGRRKREEQHQHHHGLLLTQYLRQGLSKWVWPIFLYNLLLHVGLLAVAISYWIVMGILLVVLSFLLGLSQNHFFAQLAMFFLRFSAWTASIYIFVSMFAAIPSLVVEGNNNSNGNNSGYAWFRAMQRSWDLATSRRMFVLGAHILYGLVVYVPLTLVVVVMILVPIFVRRPSIGMWGFLAILVVLALVSMVLVPFGAIFQTVLYLTVRIEKEGCRPSVLAREIGDDMSGGRSSDSTVMENDDDDTVALLYTPIMIPTASAAAIVKDSSSDNPMIQDHPSVAPGNQNV